MRKLKISLNRVYLFVMVVALINIGTFGHVGARPAEVSLSPSVVPEGRDFATRVLSDPWDMAQYSDVSKYINESNVAVHLQNIQVLDGIFSAQSTDTEAQFFTLFPGYQSAINAGKDGERYPIDSSLYRCLYIRMKVDSDASRDELRVFWFADSKLTGGANGVTQSIDIARSEWKIYAIDLTAMDDPVWSQTAWSALETWQALRIDPTIKAGVNFEVDWVRLTDCEPVNTTVSWTPTGETIEIWAGIGQPTPDFKIADSVAGGVSSYTLDVQGWDPDLYYIGVKDTSGLDWSTSPLKIDAAPRATFVKPSFSSGESLTWEMERTNDLAEARCVDYAFQESVLDLVTRSPIDLPPECAGGGMSDPQLVLALPTIEVDTTRYRYLTLRVYTEGAWQDVNNGWMMRWVWRTYEAGDPNQLCYNVSNDIPFDVGWDVLTVDLHDAFAGFTEDYGGGTYCHLRNWWDDPTDYLRLDPNENTTSASLHQQLDWVRLSQMDQVAQAQIFPVRMSLSEADADVSFNFYYTTDRAVPLQHAATMITLTARIYLPLVLRAYPFVNSEMDLHRNIARAASDENYTTFYWSTAEVPRGEYYICAEINDSLNQTIACSAAPVEVY